MNITLHTHFNNKGEKPHRPIRVHSVLETGLMADSKKPIVRDDVEPLSGSGEKIEIKDTYAPGSILSTGTYDLVDGELEVSEAPKETVQNPSVYFG